MFLHSQFVVRVGFPLNNGDGAQGAVPQAIAQAVAELIFHQASNAIDDLDGALMTGGDAEPAAIAFFFIDHDYFSGSFHPHPSGYYIRPIIPRRDKGVCDLGQS
jgi:hypothetical protein